LQLGLAARGSMGEPEATPQAESQPTALRDVARIADVEPPTSRLEVVDEDGIWVAPELDCPEQFSGVTDYAVGARGETSDLLDAARKAVEGSGLEPDDVLEQAGYPEAEVARVRLVREGEPLAVVDLIDDGTGNWLQSMVTGCSSLDEEPR
jgi:hypothetical protein